MQPYPTPDRVLPALTICDARLTTAETKIPTRIVLIVPATPASRHAAKAHLFGYPSAMILVKVPQSDHHSLPLTPQNSHSPLCPSSTKATSSHLLPHSGFIVMLVQNSAACSRNPCSLPTIIAALRTNTLCAQPYPFPRPRTSFCPPLYCPVTNPVPPFHFLQWADMRDAPSLPNLAPAPTALPYMHAITHPRSLGVIGIIPHRFDDTLSSVGLSNSAKSILHISSLLRASTISAIQKCLVREHSLFH